MKRLLPKGSWVVIMGIAVLALGGLRAVASISLPAGARPPQQAAPGLIAFAFNRDGNFEIKS